jgi:hypothetical protein
MPGTCFVVMGYGRKTDYATARVLDLDATYEAIIKPAVTDAGLTCENPDIGQMKEGYHRRHPAEDGRVPPARPHRTETRHDGLGERATSPGGPVRR